MQSLGSQLSVCLASELLADAVKSVLLSEGHQVQRIADPEVTLLRPEDLLVSDPMALSLREARRTVCMRTILLRESGL
jgi:hypothetical protein